MKSKTGNQQRKIKENKTCLSEKINKIHKPLAKLIKKKREGTQITNIRNEREGITKNFMKIKKIKKNSINNCKPANLMTYTFLEKRNLPKVTQKEIETLNRI